MVCVGDRRDGPYHHDDWKPGLSVWKPLLFEAEPRIESAGRIPASRRAADPARGFVLGRSFKQHFRHHPLVFMIEEDGNEKRTCP